MTRMAMYLGALAVAISLSGWVLILVAIAAGSGWAFLKTVKPKATPLGGGQVKRPSIKWNTAEAARAGRRYF